MKDFNGVKIALIKGDEVLTILRDDKPGLRYANLWDLPGGGREGDETPFECVAREVYEELGIKIAKESITWEKIYHSAHDPNLVAYFMAANIDDNDIKSIVFGDEGQGWKMIKIDDFLSDPAVIDMLKGRLKDYLASRT